MRFHLCLCLMLSLACVSPQAASASQELRDKLANIADSILKNTKQQAVTVGQFSPTGLPDTNNGPGIEQLLTKALEAKASGIVKADALFEVKGDYSLVNSKVNSQLKVVKIITRLISKETGEELKELRVDAELTQNRTIAEVLQVTASLDPNGTQAERNKALEVKAKQPSVHLHGTNNTLISSTADSKYAVEMLVKPLEDNDKVAAGGRKADNEKGLAFVPIDEKELYEVKVYNNSDKPAAVSLTIDGLDVFHFSKDRNDKGDPKFTHFILQAGDSFAIPGWHNSLEGTENYLSFQVMEYGKGAVTKAGISSRGKVGVIHCQFANCSPIPDGGKPKTGSETGFGPPRELQQKAVAYEVDSPHDFVTVRYTREQK